MPYVLNRAELMEKRDQLQQTITDLLSDGASLQQVADAMGIDRMLISRLRTQYPEFAQALDSAAFEGSIHILEEIREAPYQELDPARARVIIDALRVYLEMRWPQRYGKKMEITHKTVDIGDLLEKSRRRAGILIESTAYEHATTDDESVVTPEPTLEDILS